MEGKFVGFVIDLTVNWKTYSQQFQSLQYMISYP